MQGKNQKPLYNIPCLEFLYLIFRVYSAIPEQANIPIRLCSVATFRFWKTKHTVKWLSKMMGLRGRSTFMTILAIIGIADMKQQDARERGAFSADLASHTTNSGLQGFPSN